MYKVLAEIELEAGRLDHDDLRLEIGAMEAFEEINKYTKYKEGNQTSRPSGFELINDLFPGINDGGDIASYWSKTTYGETGKLNQLTGYVSEAIRVNTQRT